MIQTLDDIMRVAEIIATAKMFGIQKKEEAATLMLICQAEGLNPVAALRRYHLIEGRPSMRADAMQGEFETAGGGIIWHIRTDDTVAATFFRDKNKIDDAARQRAISRFEKLWQLSAEADTGKQSKLMLDIAKLSYDGEETMIRTLSDAVAKGIATKADGQTIKANWSTSPKQMLTAGVVRECVRLLNPALIAGIVEETEARQIAEQERQEASLPMSPEVRNRIENKVESIIETAGTLPEEDRSAAHKEAMRLEKEITNRSPEALAIAAYEAENPEHKNKVAGATKDGFGKWTFTLIESAPKKTRSPKKPEPIPAEFTESDKPWQEIVCHLGNEGGVINGKTLATIFDPKSPRRNIESTVDYFANKADPSKPKDAALIRGVALAHAAWQEANSKPASNPPKPEPTETAAPESPEHTAKLKAAIQKDGVNRNDFLSECKRAGWIDRGHTKIEDVTEAESNNLLSDWPTVVEQCLQLI